MKLFPSLLAASLLLAIGSASAHEPSKTTDQPTAMQGMDHSKMGMSKMTPADHQKMAAAAFVKLDSNKDGKLVKAEIAAPHPLAAHFAMLDTNKDGALSKAEFAKHHAMMGKSHGQMDHSKMDHGKMDHGKMTPADHQKMANAEFVKLDANQDGKLVKAEIAVGHPLSAHFGMLDSNKDGSLSKVEFAKHHGM